MRVLVVEDDPEAAVNRAAWRQLVRFDRPFLTVFAEDDPVMFRMRRMFEKEVAGAQGRVHPTIPTGGHFVPQTRPELFAGIVRDFIAQTR